MKDFGPYGTIGVDPFYWTLEWMLDAWLGIEPLYSSAITSAWPAKSIDPIEEIKAVMKAYYAVPPPVSHRGLTIYCHPCHVETLESLTTGQGGIRLFGLKIVPNQFMPKWRRRWVPPYDRFIEYEPSDTWAERLGMGHYEDTDEPYLLEINESYLEKMFKPPPFPLCATWVL